MESSNIQPFWYPSVIRIIFVQVEGVVFCVYDYATMEVYKHLMHHYFPLTN